MQRTTWEQGSFIFLFSNKQQHKKRPGNWADIYLQRERERRGVWQRVGTNGGFKGPKFWSWPSPQAAKSPALCSWAFSSFHRSWAKWSPCVYKFQWIRRAQELIQFHLPDVNAISSSEAQPISQPGEKALREARCIHCFNLLLWQNTCQKPRREGRFILAHGLRRDSLSPQRRKGEVQEGRIV